MPKINQEGLLSIPLPIPPITEQSRIVAKVDELMAECDKLESLASDASGKGEKLLESVLGKVFVQ